LKREQEAEGLLVVATSKRERQEGEDPGSASLQNERPGGSFTNKTIKGEDVIEG